MFKFGIKPFESFWGGKFYLILLPIFKIYSKENYDYLIVQTLVGRDLERDRYKSAFGLARPYFTKADKTSELMLNMPIDKNYPNTKYGPTKAELLDYLLSQNDKDRGYVPFDISNEIVLLVNNLGGTSVT